MVLRTVEMKNFAFTPETVVINVGDSVEWVNRDNAMHNAARDAAPTFSTALLNKDESSAPITFTQASEAAGFAYFCAPHKSFMTGTVVVVLPGSHMGSYSRDEALREHNEKKAHKK